MSKLRIRAKRENDWLFLGSAVDWLMGPVQGVKIEEHTTHGVTYSGDLASIEVLHDRMRHFLGRFPLEIEILADH